LLLDKGYLLYSFGQSVILAFHTNYSFYTYITRS
jgi:hypothetical protein